MNFVKITRVALQEYKNCVPAVLLATGTGSARFEVPLQSMDTSNELLTLEELDSEQMAAYINQLIDKDFSRLVQILYRLDVSEVKLKNVLQENIGLDAGIMIAQLIIERIAQSKKARESFNTSRNIPEDEKW